MKNYIGDESKRKFKIYFENMPIYAKVEDVRKFFGICEKNNIAVIDQVFF